MFNANDARRYPGFFTRTWTPPPDGFSLNNARSQRSAGAAFAHATPPPLTPRLASPIDVRGLAASDPVGRLNLSRASPEGGMQASRALVGMSREEPDISPHISTLDVRGPGRFTATHPSRHGWEDMPQGERMNYTARLEEDVGHMQNTLDRAYHLRDHYKEEAARLNNELLQKKRELDRLERDRRQCSEIISRHQREEADLRQRLDCAEGEVQRLQTLMQSADPGGCVLLMDAERKLRQKQTEVDSLLEEKRQLEECLRSFRLGRSSEHGPARVHEGPDSQPLNGEQVVGGDEELARAQHVIQVLRAELQDMRQQLQNERSKSEGTLDEVIQQRNGLQGVNTSLREELEGLKAMCRSQNKTIDDLRDTLLQRAPVTHHEHHALVQQCERLKDEVERHQTRESESVNKALEIEKQAIQQQLFALRSDGEAKNSLLLQTRADVAQMREHIRALQAELDLTQKAKALLEQEVLATKERLQCTTEQNKEAKQVITDFSRRLQDQFSTIQALEAQIEHLHHQPTGRFPNLPPSNAALFALPTEGKNRGHEKNSVIPTTTPSTMPDTAMMQQKEAQRILETAQAVMTAPIETQGEGNGQIHNTAEDHNNLPPQLLAAEATTDQLSAERDAKAEHVAELAAAVARLEGRADTPGHVVEALTAELRGTQDRLRQAEEEAGQLAERLGASEERRESAVAARSADTALAAQLSSALKTLEQVAEEREALAAKSAELERRVGELEQELRDAQAARAADPSDGPTLREQLLTAEATIDQLSAERDAQAEHVAELAAAVARLEGRADTPGRVVEALTAELRETQDRLRQAEEEAGQLAERLGASEERRESAVAARSADTALAAQLSSAPKTLEQLAEEREALAAKSAELERRVGELEQELRDAQAARAADPSDGPTLREQLLTAEATIDQLSAERDAQAEHVAELAAAVARLEGRADTPGRVVEALTAELRETQDRLRQAEEEAGQLAERLGASEERRESAVAARSADTALAAQLSSALKTLEQVAEEREALAAKSAELERRVGELEQELRDAQAAQAAHDADPSDGPTLREQLLAAEATIDQLSAERDAQAEHVAELAAAVARLEGRADTPGRVVEALTAELRETQDRLRQAEEEAGQLAERLGASGERRESAVAARSADTALAARLSSALAALEQVAEEREALAAKSAELERRVGELEQELRDAQAAHDADPSDGPTLREQLLAAEATIDQLSAERDAQAEHVAELAAAVARLEGRADTPGRVVEALTAELRETQDRLRQAEEEAGQLAERLGASEERRESAVAARSADTALAAQLSSAPKTLEQLAEEREALAAKSAELERRVGELEQELRDAQAARAADPSDGPTLREQLLTAEATIDQLSAERDAQAEHVAELAAAVARLEGRADTPGRVVEALTAELRETQDRLRQAEEEAGQLAERLGASEERRESAVAARSADTALAAQLSSALKTLEQVAEEREALAAKSAELERRVGELEQELRDAQAAQAAHDADPSDGPTLREQLLAAEATIDQLSAERDAQAEHVAELAAAVARLEGRADTPGRVVEALTAELRETQDRLRQAEEEAGQLAERLGASEERRESAVAARSADTALAARLSSALAALEQLAEEREALAAKSAELERRVGELEQELRDAQAAQAAHDADPSDGPTLREQLLAAEATIDQLSAERDAQAEHVAELAAAVARLEGRADTPGRVVEALTAELRETQDRLRQAEEEAGQLAERLGASGERRESAVAARSADTALAAQLSSALKTLEQVAEEREALAAKSAELERRVGELEQELRDAQAAQAAHDADPSDGPTLREQLLAAEATIDQLSAERDAQAEHVAELAAAVARLEGRADTPGRVVEALTAELRETQDRLRQAEEEAGQLAERLGASEERRESAVAARSADTALAARLSSALAALEQLAEEREALAAKSAELERRVGELEQELRDAQAAQAAHDADPSDGPTLREQLLAAEATIDQLSAERDAQAEHVAELAAAVARLEGRADTPGRVVEALTAELRETQDRLRQAEEEAGQLAERLGASGERRESAVAARSADTALAARLSSALAALEQVAEEREALAAKSAELERRVGELEQELRDAQAAQAAHDADPSDGPTLREQLLTAEATIDQLSAERDAQAEHVAELAAAVARLEGRADIPGRVVEALTAELRETQDRLRQAEEEAGQLAERLGASGERRESAVAARSADTALAARLSSALAALEQVAEEREALAAKSAELERRVGELEQELRDAQAARAADPSDGPTLREQLLTAEATIDQLSAERDAQAEHVAELAAAVARLEGRADIPGRVVEALTAELRETQDRLRQAEEEAGQLAERLGASEERRESAVAARSADTALAARLSSALAALEQVAEEREALAAKSAELERRVGELEQELRDTLDLLAVKNADALKLRQECEAKGCLLSNALAAVDRVVEDHVSAEATLEEQKSSLVKTFDVLHEQFMLTKKGFEEQWERRAEACAAELLSARRSAQRANEARKRAEENAAACMREVERAHAELMKVQRDYRALERLLRSSGRLSMSRVETNDGEEHEREVSLTTTSLRNTEGAELAQFLQISSLQADLMLSRRTCHQLEARQGELQTALEQSEWRLASLPLGVEESHAELLRVRGQLETVQVEYHRLEERFRTLKRRRVEEVEQLQQQNERLVLQLREKRDKVGSLSRQMRDSEVAAKRQAEELAQAFNLLESQMRALREEVGGGQPPGPQAKRPGRRPGAKEMTEAEGKMLHGRITFLEHTLKQKETEMRRLQEELECNEAQLDQFEHRITVATQRLETTSRRSTHLEQTVHALKRTNQELRQELDVAKASGAAQAERRSSQRAASVDVSREASQGGRASSLSPAPARGEQEGRAASAIPRVATKRPRALDTSL